MGPIATVSEATEMVRRRAPLILGIMIFGFLISVKLGLGQHPVFEAREVMQVVPPKVSQVMALTTVDEPIVQMLPLLRENLLSDSAMMEIVMAYDLFADPGLSPMDRVQRLRRSVSVDWSVSQEDGGPGRVEVAATARLSDAQQAQLVAQELAHRLINQSASMRINAARSTLEFLSGSERDLRRDLSELQARIAARRGSAAQSDAVEAPEVHAEMESYGRDLERLSASLSEAVQWRQRAETGLDLETHRQSERLVVTNPAALPERPVIDTRGAVVAAGGAVSAALAFLVAWLLDIRNPVIRSASQMRRITGLTPLIVIPRTTSRVGWRTKLRHLLNRTHRLI